MMYIKIVFIVISIIAFIFQFLTSPKHNLNTYSFLSSEEKEKNEIEKKKNLKMKIWFYIGIFSIIILNIIDLFKNN